MIADPPDLLRASLERRLRLIEALAHSPEGHQLEMELCRRAGGVLRWFDNFAWTYNPQIVNGLNHLPFDLFPRQREFILWIDTKVTIPEDGVVAKSREIGFTYMMAGYALHRWLFSPGFKTTFASRTKDLVDKVGNSDSIFEKIRIMLRALPRWMLPVGFNSSIHDNYCRLVNPATGDTITGEGGDDIGRGGRSSLIVIDEAAFLEHAERVERSTSANAKCRIWGSTVNSFGDFFDRKRATMPPGQVFRFHYRDDPRKDAVWEAKERKRLEEHDFAAEYEIDSTGSVEGIAIPAKWVESAKRLKHVLAEHKLAMEPDVRGIAGLDVGAGKARSVLISRFGGIVLPPVSWRDPDTTETAFRALEAAAGAKMARSNGAECTIKVLRFDEPGVGKGVLSTLSHHQMDGITTVPVNTGVPPSDTTWPDGMTSEEKFGNLKAEVWWLMRDRFKCTHEMVLFLEGKPGGERHNLSELISLPDDDAGPDCTKLASELSNLKYGRNEKGKIVMETKIQLRTRGVPSPDYADALAISFDPDSTIENWLGAFGV